MLDLFLDTETSGLSDDYHGVWQIAAILYKDNKEIDIFEMKAQISSSKEWHDQAWQLSELSREAYEELPSGFNMHLEFTKFLKKHVNPFNRKDKMNFYAYNSPFDNRHMRSFFTENGDNYFGSYFWNPDICVMRLAMEKLKSERRRLPNFRLATVATHLNIPLPEVGAFHDALYDVKVTKDIYDKLK